MREIGGRYNRGMETIVDYLEREQRTFSELAFSPVDSLVLSSLVYFNFDAAGVVERQSAREVLLHDVVALTPHEALTSASWLEDAELTGRFVRAVMASRRLRNVRVTFFANEFASVIEKQFSAVTFVLPQAFCALRDAQNGAGKADANDCADVAESGAACGVNADASSASVDADAQDLLYLAFRGTDGTLAGWKEDFNLTFKDVIPSQAAALQYLSGVASASTRPLMLGGHSKGGNLAQYAALTCDDAVFERIVGIYDHDGPSFFDDPSLRINDSDYLGRLHKSVPSSSVFGLMLERRQNYEIVESDALPFLSHSPFTWMVQGASFVRAERLTRGSVAFDRSLDEWLHSVDATKRELFIDTVYELFMSTEATTWSEFQENLPKNLATMARHGAELDGELRGFLMRTFAQGVGILTSSTARNILPDPTKRLPLRRVSYERRSPSSGS